MKKEERRKSKERECHVKMSTKTHLIGDPAQSFRQFLHSISQLFLKWFYNFVVRSCRAIVFGLFFNTFTFMLAWTCWFFSTCFL